MHILAASVIAITATTLAGIVRYGTDDAWRLPSLAYTFAFLAMGVGIVVAVRAHRPWVGLAGLALGMVALFVFPDCTPGAVSLLQECGPR